MPMATASLRERHKQRRRGMILEAARTLLRERPADAIGVDEVAALAEVSVATVYNLVGNRAQLWAALLDAMLDRLDEQLAPLDVRCPIAKAAAAITESAAMFLSDAAVARQIISLLGGWTTRRATLRHNPAEPEVAAMRAAVAAGIIDRRFDPVVLGQQIYTSYLGALHLWAAGRLPDERLVPLALHGLYSVVGTAVRPRHRADVEQMLLTLGAQLRRGGSVRKKQATDAHR